MNTVLARSCVTLFLLVAVLSLSLLLRGPVEVGQAAPPSPIAGPLARATVGGGLNASSTSVYTGDQVKFTGWLVRGKMNQKAFLQIRRDGAWRSVDRDYTNRRGQFVHKIDMDYESGTYRFRVFGKASRLYDAPEVITRKVRITVRDRPGSANLPWRPGQWFAAGNWRFLFGNTLTDAWPTYRSQSQYADPPPAGYAYIAVPMTFQRTGTTSGQARWDTTLEFVGSDGVVYWSLTQVGSTEYSCYLDDDWSDSPELYPGASASGSDCMLVRQSAISGGMWRLEGDYDEPQQFITIN